MTQFVWYAMVLRPDPDLCFLHVDHRQFELVHETWLDINEETESVRRQ